MNHVISSESLTNHEWTNPTTLRKLWTAKTTEGASCFAATRALHWTDKRPLWINKWFYTWPCCQLDEAAEAFWTTHNVFTHCQNTEHSLLPLALPLAIFCMLCHHAWHGMMRSLTKTGKLNN